MTRITQKWIEDALQHIELAEYIKIPREQFIELVQAARNGLRPVLAYQGEPTNSEPNIDAAVRRAGIKMAPPKAI